ncbi:tyrosine-type recombinase/integrase [Streptomyces sp. NRRL B-3648]|uniref:tyrosine-type recombinase/integrase n=1 Tax=Streptomyces sp. NRRL B-3648 TaxID=1519493 RepID=UPI0006B001B8|nr:tyrosine-type recombinase/integrase [Streptomyces sp. NRRL B-3648]KOX05282.1 hypothetical protein ADL04_07500 [Streptomyces sp. NRRL B-3648]
MAARDLWTESDLVFTTRYGTPVEPRNFTREFNRRCDRAEVRRIRVHDIRHTCASLLAALDVHPRIATQILRHSEIAGVVPQLDTHPRGSAHFLRCLPALLFSSAWPRFVRSPRWR